MADERGLTVTMSRSSDVFSGRFDEAKAPLRRRAPMRGDAGRRGRTLVDRFTLYDYVKPHTERLVLAWRDSGPRPGACSSAAPPITARRGRPPWKSLTDDE